MRKSTIVNDRDRVVELYRSGLSLSSVARELGFKSHVSVLKILQKCGVQRRSQSDGMRGLQNARKHCIKEDYFSSIDNEMKAYYLGVMFADGWVTDDGVIGLSMRDSDVVEGLRDAVESDYKVGRRGAQFELIMSSRIMVSDLSGYGCVPRKSWISLKIPSLRDDLIRHFVRGYYDGDGGFRVRRSGQPVANIVGCKTLLDDISNVLEKATGRLALKPKPHASIWRLTYSGSKRVAGVLDWIYKDANMFMERKKKMYFNWRSLWNGDISLN